MNPNLSSDIDLICVGNAVVDAFLKVQNENSHIRLNEETNELCIKSGEKIQLEDYIFLLGGNACNVSVGSSRLGLKTSFCAELGDDDFSKKIIDGLTKERVNLTFLKRSEGKSSSLAMAINFKNERTLFVRHVQREHDFNLNQAKTKWVYLTSLGKEWKKAYKNTLLSVKNNNAKLALNPGTNQIEEGVDSFKEEIASAEILFVNKTEAQHLILNEEENEIKNLLLKLKNLGSKIIVITDGNNGSFVIDQNGRMLKLGIFSCKVVQKTGAGDAFTSGFLGATILGLPISEAMRWGAVNASGVIQKTGAQEGLLTRAEIEEKLKYSEDLRVEEI